MLSRAMVRILLYGDSLIAGYQHFHGPIESWAPVLEHHLTQALGRPVAVAAHGVGGLTASAMLRHNGLRSELHGTKFDAVCIHAGANDYMHAAAASTIAQDIAALHGLSRDAGAKAVSLGIPLGPGVGSSEGLTEVNQRIASAGGADLFVDSAALMPYEQNKQLWSSDGVHLTEEGYSEWARRMAGPLATLLRDAGGHAAHKGARRQKGEGPSML